MFDSYVDTDMVIVQSITTVMAVSGQPACNHTQLFSRVWSGGPIPPPYVDAQGLATNHSFFLQNGLLSGFYPQQEVFWCAMELFVRKYFAGSRSFFTGGPQDFSICIYYIAATNPRHNLHFMSAALLCSAIGDQPNRGSIQGSPQAIISTVQQRNMVMHTETDRGDMDLDTKSWHLLQRHVYELAQSQGPQPLQNMSYSSELLQLTTLTPFRVASGCPNSCASIEVYEGKLTVSSLEARHKEIQDKHGVVAANVVVKRLLGHASPWSLT
jgi:hypothetical protein